MTALSGGILAAGEGSRLRSDGWTVPKPLVPVAGVSLIEHSIENFVAAGVERIAIIFNEAEEDCAAFVRSRFPGLHLELLLRTTGSSFESFRALSGVMPPGRALFSTVDGWCPRADFVEFVRTALAAPVEESVIAVTPFVDDERPLWVRTRTDGSGSVAEIGAESGDAVTAGAYLFSARARGFASSAPADRLRGFLRWLVTEGEPVRAVSIAQVVDVDRGRDVRVAEDLARRRPAAREAAS